MSILVNASTKVVTQGMMIIFFLALAAAAAAQDAPRSADAEILELYTAVCVRGEEAPAGFQAVEWSAFPAALRLMNTYGHGGAFLTRDAGGRTLYIARTSGAGQDRIVEAERRCGVAIRGANFDRLTRAFREQLRARPLASMRIGGHQIVMFPSPPRGVLSVSESDEGWIIVRAYDMSFRSGLRGQ